jgi:hypothetical protein
MVNKFMRWQSLRACVFIKDRPLATELRIATRFGFAGSEDSLAQAKRSPAGCQPGLSCESLHASGLQGVRTPWLRPNAAQRDANLA